MSAGRSPKKGFGASAFIVTCHAARGTTIRGATEAPGRKAVRAMLAQVALGAGEFADHRP
ncbi:MAG: hypothetical protein AAF264_02200 [Pseudomonadota bacterium]